jgi:hypothetical protein
VPGVTYIRCRCPWRPDETKLPLPGLLLCGAAVLAAATARSANVGATDTTPVPAVPRPARWAGWQHGAFMEIFVRAWRDSDGDGIGDLRGLTQSLDHLQDLGIRGIWLMPITKPTPTATTATPPPTSAPWRPSTARWPTSTS